jgi:hypothetical protein
MGARGETRGGRTIKTLSDHPLLIGEILTRCEQRRARAARRQRIHMMLERHPLAILGVGFVLAIYAGALAALIEYLITGRP